MSAVVSVGGKCRYCGCTDAAMGKDDTGQEAGWATMQRDVCTKPQCLTAWRRDGRSGKREIERLRKAAVQPIRKQVNQAAKRKRERWERAVQSRSNRERT